ncbi:hypothetical protein ASPWEDRAFT_108689 [Aspergillus wentii DTO 134E9]|uniref:Trimethyllysine dioxygenase n=1 Tax=Aspergillus wentii DTO 134E9 TaxID=1073089 RepID=A0A1L9RP82_ASPWE|nr:uncharacterized protein ASPWEDRAFT_108689 [Aspergillus wentii DTO 134E9]OJJ36648.1 hypothetical protein ASPWEDRAFT_108689 [Aspergillus wentii DTO 134E9]
MSAPGAGHQFPSQEVSWQKRDVLLFANSIGCKADELHFLYELHPNFAVFPTYSLILPFKLTDQEVTDFYARSQGSPIPGVPKFDYRRVVDGQRKLTLLKPLPPSSAGKKFELRNKVIGVYDKGKPGTVVETEQSIVDETGEVYSKTVSSNFFVAQGNWGGPKGPSTVSYAPPEGRKPDAVHVIQSTLETAHLYRLNGDYNPLHATPEPGQQMGFGGIIIHGLFSWNSAAHGILRELGGSDPKNLKEFQARFASPVRPGDKLTTEIWRMGIVQDGFEEVRFVTKNDKDKVVLSNGRCLLKVVGPKSKLPRIPQLASGCRIPSIGLRSKHSSSWTDAQKNNIQTQSGERILGPERIPDHVQLKVNPEGNIGNFGPFWLRENCQCAKCIHPDTKQRAIDTFSMPLNVRARNVEYDTGGAKIEWSDGHIGDYPFDWLLPHQEHTSLNRNLVKPEPMSFRPMRSLVPGQSSPKVSYEKVMSEDRYLFEWLDKIYSWGFCFVEGIPINPESTQALIERIAFIRHTHYGGFWDFTADLTFKDTAYTNEFLGSHTDNTYFTDPARLQLFHLLSHTDGDGGENLLVDGFKAAQIMQEENPEGLATLASTKHPFHTSGNEDTCIQPVTQARVLETHPEFGYLYQVRWNNYDRAPKSDWSIREQYQWYEAARHWDEIIKRPEMEIWTQFKPGTAIIFDNWRILHGRSEFTGKRRMCGGYVNNDDFISRFRLLKFGREKVLQNLGNFRASPDNPNYFI